MYVLPTGASDWRIDELSPFPVSHYIHFILVILSRTNNSDYKIAPLSKILIPVGMKFSKTCSF